ncbi:MAG: metal ABC transporter substrate-binding protein [Chloroflexota bacterium]|jgi:ABC-type Zn uptake system ZnuABC Zn-binding protein ZnuA
MKRKTSILLTAWIAVLLAAGCAAPPPPAASEAPLQVVATTSIVADIVQQIGGERVQVTTLLPLGSDPHAYEPAPQDIARVSEAALVFASGAGLEEFLERLIANAGAQERLVQVSEGIQLKDFGVEKHAEEEKKEGEEHAEEEGEEHAYESGDPHTWVDPHNVKVWVENIRARLSEIDPAGADLYQANAARYLTELDELDGWIREQIAQIPAENRKIVTDHQVFGYFAERYGLQQVGAIIPGYSTAAAPSAQEVAAIEDAIRALGVRAVFVGETIAPALAQRVAEDTGVQLVFVYHGSLSAPDGPAATYLDYMRYNVNAMVAALK